jgi:hypothetical protein
MEKQNKVLIISIIIFVIVALLALGIVLNKGKVFGKSLVATSDSQSETIAQEYVVEVSSDKDYISAKSKEEATLTVLVDGEEKSEGIEFTSSDEDIATVDENGVVKAVGVGSATITAKYQDSEGTVDIKSIVPITSMKFTSTSSSIKVGNDLQLKLQVTPSDASIDTLIYSSSDDETATVNKNGIVTGKQKGKVTITLHDTYTGEEKSVNLTIR